jgi:23S rRNA pseudouridine1911/1915/1917 synthase
VLVDGLRRPKGHRLQGGERVAIPDPPSRAPEDAAGRVARIAWENDDLLVVDKPAGLVVHPAPGHRGVTLVEQLARDAGDTWQPLAVHRLDRDTSGLMLVAKRPEVRDELQQLIRSRRLVREYVALAEGRLRSRTGTIDAPLGRGVRDRTRMVVGGSRSREARTHFTVERFLEGFTLVRVRLETGRTHQIRAHFAAIGHPLAGDRAYGGRSILGLERQFLHSARIAFRYSGEGAGVDESSPLPADLAEALRRAEA